MKIIDLFTSHRFFLAWIILLVVLFSGMRLIYINADAPQDLTISASIYTDEGFKTYGPRNRVLYGSWQWTPADEYENWVSRSPLPTALYTEVFKEFGISFASIRVVSAVFSILTMVLLYLFVTRCYGRKTGVISLLLMGANFISVMFSRLGFFELHLNFFIIATVFSFYELFSRNNVPFSSLKPGFSHKALIVFYKTFFLLLGIAGMIASFYTKRSFLIIVVAIIPALVLLFAKNRFGQKVARRLFTVMVIGVAALYLLLAHIGKLQYFVNLFLSLKIFGNPLITYIPLKSFDPIHLAAGKGMYIEFIFLQPLTLFAALLFGFYVIYRFLVKEEGNALDLILSSWLIFGFILLSLMSYHPARYYLMLLIPLIVLGARFICSFAEIDLKGFLNDRRPLTLTVLRKIFVAIAVLYSGVILVVHILPFSLRNSLMKAMYPSFLTGDFTDAIPIMAGLAAVEITAVVLIIVFRKRIRDLLFKPGFASAVLIVILGFQLFQFGKWISFREYDLCNLSREIGSELEENAIIIGSWSAGIVIENRLRPLVIQDKNPYNTSVVQKLLDNRGIPVTYKTTDGHMTIVEKNQPLYLAVCEDVVFEMSILKRYNKYLKEENLIKKTSLGYFDVNLYRLERIE